MMQPKAERSAIAGLGRVLGPEVLAAVQDLYRTEQRAATGRRPAAATDLAYGDEARQRLDLYRPEAAGAAAPVLLWVHGGGFLRGGKGGGDDPFNAHAGRWAASAGMVGAVMNYRLAPDHGWPAGGEDVGLAVDWLRANIAEHGGDPARIVLMGTSAGAVHCAAHLALRGDAAGVCGAVLLSGLYGFTPLDARDTLYYGPAELYPERRPRDAVIATTLPLLLAVSEFDPPRFQAEFAGLVAARQARHGTLPRLHYASGHNHFSLAYHLGTTDGRLADEVAAFVRERCMAGSGETS